MGASASYLTLAIQGIIMIAAVVMVTLAFK
jgi:hypothetical protein